MHQCFMMSWLRITKKEYGQTFKSKDKEWKLKHDYKNLKGSDYQPDQPQKLNKLMLPNWIEVTKSSFGEIQSIVTEAKNNKLKTNVGKKVVTVNSIEDLIKDITSRKIKLGKDRFNIILDNSSSKIAGLKIYTKSQNKILHIFRFLKEMFIGYTGDDETDDKTDDELLVTTYMSDLENEESPEQRRNQEGQGLKILTPNQTLSRLTIFLLQLQAGNNLEKLKNEIRQLLYLLYHTKKFLAKAVYNNLINTI